jgi:hypothetical protein
VLTKNWRMELDRRAHLDQVIHVYHASLESLVARIASSSKKERLKLIFSGADILDIVEAPSKK